MATISSGEEKDELYVSIASISENRRHRQSLDRVKEACDFLDKNKAPITPTSVGRYCESKWGGPKAQSIRNANQTLFAYLKARMSSQTVPARKKDGNYEPPISDEIVRAYVTLIKTERDEALRAKNRIINGLRSIPGIDIDTLISTGFKEPRGNSAAHQELPAVAKQAIKKILDPLIVERFGLELYRDRLRHTVTKEVLLDKAEIESIRSLLGPAAPQQKGAPTGDKNLLLGSDQ